MTPTSNPRKFVRRTPLHKWHIIRGYHAHCNATYPKSWPDFQTTTSMPRLDTICPICVVAMKHGAAANSVGAKGG